MTDIKKDTIIRTVVLVLALVNQVLTSTGHAIIPISDDQITELISLAFTIVAAIWTWWKNNSFTKNAIEADKLLKTLKEVK
jgi:SPP1 family holin